ncbi:MAG: hypothetical protein ACYTFD_19060 [Planctomycetota bacterium]|jgi:hypothetical protein
MRRTGLDPRPVLCALLLLLPVGCSSSSGKGTAQVTITSANAMEVAGVILGAIDFLQNFSELATEFVDVFEGGGGTRTIPCISESISAVVNDTAPLDEISTGDSAVLTFNSCVYDFDGDQLTLSGTMSFTVTSFAVNPGGGFDATLSYTFNSFVIATPAETITVSGGFVIDISTPDDIAFTLIVQVSSLSATIQDLTGTFTAGLANFRMAVSDSDAAPDYTAEMDGTVSHSDIGGSVTVDTTVTFAGTDPDDPDTGEMDVNGAGVSMMTFEVVDNINVQLHVDEDGDGTPETTIDTTWNDLED